MVASSSEKSSSSDTKNMSAIKERIRVQEEQLKGLKRQYDYMKEISVDLRNEFYECYNLIMEEELLRKPFKGRKIM